MRPDRINDFRTQAGAISVNNILSMQDATTPRTPRLQLLSPLNGTSGVFERRKNS
jgi:hypothetical protein